MFPWIYSFGNLVKYSDFFFSLLIKIPPSFTRVQFMCKNAHDILRLSNFHVQKCMSTEQNKDITYLNKTDIFALRFKLVQNFVLFSLSLK